MYTGLIAGMLLAFVMKRSRLCFAGGLRDIYFKRKLAGLAILFIVFALQGAIFFSLAKAGIVPGPKDDVTFSLTATMVGAFIFGFGAILANGCTVSMLMKVGDGRFNGVVGLLSFFIFVLASKNGLFTEFIKKWQKQHLISDNYGANYFNFFWLFYLLLGVVAVILVVRALKNTPKPKYSLPARYTGIKHILLEKNWHKYVAALIIGVAAGLSFYLSHIAGRTGSWGITTPTYSWINAFTTTEPKLSWASFFVLGIVVGAFLTALVSGELSLKVGNAQSVARQVIGGALMAFGAVLAKGCLVGFGMTGLAQASLQSLIGIIFITFGLWFGAWFVYKRTYN